MTSVDCPVCGETTLYDPEKGLDDLQVVEAPNGERFPIWTVRCQKCGAKVPAGGRDGKGNV
jgi:ribosomal protein S27E